MSGSDTDHRLEDIAVRDPRVSDAIDEPMRAMILDILSEEALTATEVHDQLEGRGVDRTENTVRHHINELRDAGLVDVVRFEEGRGGTTKYYHANTIVLSYSLPESTDATVEELIDAVEPQIEDALATLTDEHDESIEEIVADMQPCEHCRTQKYETYVLLTVLRRAFVRAHHHSQGSNASALSVGDEK
ncbi:ArsR/SmtB family transcription factor [Halosimplex sp. J119]